MIEHYIPEHFSAHELVPPKVYKDRGDKAFQLIDVRVLLTLDALRERFDSMTVNNYYWGKDRKWSGLRTPDSPYYSPYSQHTFGRAADCLFKKHSADVVRREILDNPDHFPFITFIELDVNWLHFDVRNIDNRIVTWSPKRS